MSARVTLVSVVVLLFVATAASAQTWEVSGLVGYTPSATLERHAPEVDELSMQSGFTWGVQAARSLTAHWGTEVVWVYQDSGIGLVANGSDTTLFTMTVKELHGNIVYRVGAADARLQPFAFAGAGGTMFQADEVETETKFSLALGGGLKFFPWRSLGVRGHLRYKPTFLNDESAEDFCDPFGFCQGMLSRLEFAGGVVWRF
jgi:opacity protein-like surface antigen